MSEALLLALVAVVPTTIGVVSTYALTFRKNRTDGDQGFTRLLLEERKELKAEIKACYDEIRMLRADVEILQGKQRRRAEQDEALDELDKQIRHDGSTLIRNLLTVLIDHGIDRPDLHEKARVLEKIRDMRREAAGLAIMPALVPR